MQKKHGVVFRLVSLLGLILGIGVLSLTKVNKDADSVFGAVNVVHADAPQDPNYGGCFSEGGCAVGCVGGCASAGACQGPATGDTGGQGGTGEGGSGACGTGCAGASSGDNGGACY